MNLFNNSSRVPVIDYSKCMQCGKCMLSCPKQAISKPTASACEKCIGYCITMNVPCNPRNYIFDYSLCNGCEKCLSACASEAIYWYEPKLNEWNKA